MNGGLSQVFNDVQYEITDIKRVAEYRAQAFAIGKSIEEKWIAGPNEDIALVRIHVKSLGKNKGFSLALWETAIQDVNGEIYPGKRSRLLGGKESITNPKEYDYELPYEVPKLSQFASFRLFLLVPVEEEQRTTVQKINFNISALN